MTPKHLLITDCSEIHPIIFLFFLHTLSFTKNKIPSFLIFHSRAAAVCNTPPMTWCLFYHTGREEILGPKNVTGENQVLQTNWEETLSSRNTVIQITADTTGSPNTRILTWKTQALHNPKMLTQYFYAYKSFNISAIHSN